MRTSELGFPAPRVAAEDQTQTTAARFPVVLYGRVSKLARTAKTTDKSTSVDDQLEYLRGWAAREGWPVVNEFRDDGISASRFGDKERADWQKVIDALESGQARGVLVYEFSRASRDMVVTNALEATCRMTGAQIGYGGSLKDLSTTDGWFQVGLDGLLAARLSAEISEKVTRGVLHRVATGEPHGDVPWGYRIVRDERGRAVEREEDPEVGPIVRRMAERLLSGDSAHSLAKELNERGVFTRRGKRWTGGSLSRALRNPSLAGFRVHDGAIVPDVSGTWPALLSVSDHLRLVALNEDPERDKYRTTNRTRHLGSGVFRCGVDGCGGRMRVMSRPGDKSSSYSCRECAKVSRSQGPVDDWVTDHVIARLQAEDFLAELTDPVDEDEQRDAVSDIARLDADMREARAMLEREEITLVDFAAYRKGWEPRKARAEEIARPTNLPDAVMEMAGPDARAKWDTADVKNRRKVVDWLMRVVILPVGRDNGRVFDEDSVRIEWRDHRD